MAIMTTAITSCKERTGTLVSSNAPATEPTTVWILINGNRRPRSSPFFYSRANPRALRKINANLLVATAMCGSMPH
jgi:hypothetical protein